MQISVGPYTPPAPGEEPCAVHSTTFPQVNYLVVVVFWLCIQSGCVFGRVDCEVLRSPDMFKVERPRQRVDLIEISGPEVGSVGEF